MQPASPLMMILALAGTTAAATTSTLHAVGGGCVAGAPAQSGWAFDGPAIKFGATGCLSDTPNWAMSGELAVVPCNDADPMQNFTFNASSGLVHHGPGLCLAINVDETPSDALHLNVAACAGRPVLGHQMIFVAPSAGNNNVLATAATASGTRVCISAAADRPGSWPPRLYDLWTGHDHAAAGPGGIYRIPSMITTNNGTICAFAQARVHSTDSTPSSVVMRRSFDDGETWEPSRIVLPDYFNATEQVGETLYDPATDTIFFFENHVDFRNRHPGCSTCALWQMSSTDHGLTWSNQTVIQLANPAANQTEPWGGGNRTFGGGLASGIALQGGPHKGRLLAALRHDCGCNDQPASFVVYSDDHGKTWTGGALLPEPGEKFPGMPPGAPNQTNGARGGWTECQVAEMKNGSVILTSRNLYAQSSGMAGRMFARSDDGGANWAQIWSAINDPALGLESSYCEGSIIGVPDKGVLYFGKGGHRREDYLLHSSTDGLVWKEVAEVFKAGAAYSDLTITRQGEVGVVFERGTSDRNPYVWLTFGKVKVGSRQ